MPAFDLLNLSLSVKPPAVRLLSFVHVPFPSRKDPGRFGVQGLPVEGRGASEL